VAARLELACSDHLIGDPLASESLLDRALHRFL
jgi:hypothetical protein